MQVHEIRQRFIQFFQGKGHTFLPSSSLVPHNDPTLLFTNAGMNQFKDYFTGKAEAPFKRAVTVQKCVRAGGKHNDLENVGMTARHHTFFEMLGNFSFGDYFKKEAIAFAWEFLTKELKIPADRLYVTVHHTDEEAKAIWMNDIGLSEDRIFKRDKDNFWEMGEFGPCGPCSEIFYDHGPEYDSGLLKQDLLDDDQRYVEIWNLVFMQYEKKAEGTFPLPHPCIDTGAGLERISAVMQHVYWNYDTDCFGPLFDQLEKLSGHKRNEHDYASFFRVVADHIRSSTMLITDGVLPSNEGRGYVLRRIIRRAIRHLRELGISEISFYKLVPTVFDILGPIYESNKANSETAKTYLEIEEKKFRETLELGLKFLEESLKELKGKELSGDVAFKLFDTYGLPLDLTEVILRERGLSLDHSGFEEAMHKQKELSRQSWKGMGEGQDKTLFYDLLSKFGETHFVGYEHLSTKATLLHEQWVGEQRILLFDQTPFYAESGGQLGDQGVLVLNNGQQLAIYDVQKPLDNFWVHLTKDPTPLEAGTSYALKVDSHKRALTARNHTATHLLQQALIDVLGPHIKQAGSSVSFDRLRFDFTHPVAVKKEELKEVERKVNEKIAERLSVEVQLLSKEEAIKQGATALFGEKYGDTVRVIKVDSYSQELCGGTHIANTQEIGLFSILLETSLSSGVRRIEALTSETAIKRLMERSLILEQVERTLKLPSNQVSERVETCLEKIKNLETTVADLSLRIDQFESEKIFDHLEQLTSNIFFKCVEVKEGQDLRRLSDFFIDKHPEGLLLLHMVSKGKRSVLLRTHKKNTHIDCSKLLNTHIVHLKGKGGGRCDMAQGSGEEAGELFQTFLAHLRQTLSK